MFGPIAYASVGIVDVSAPGAPAFDAVDQINNSEVRLAIRLPAVDADGSPITGLKRLLVVSAGEGEGSYNPFEGLGAGELSQVPGAVVQELTLSESDAGSLKELTFAALSVGKRQWFAAVCSDE